MQIAEPFITRSQLEQKFAQVKNLKSMSTQSKPPLGNKPGTHRESSAEIDRLKGEVATLKARLASAPATTASRTPHLDEFARLKGAEATSFYRQHSKAIAAEQTLAGLIAKRSDRNHHARPYHALRHRL